MLRKVADGAVAAGRSDEIKCGEFAGRSAADCAAVMCCCPFTVMSLLHLAVYKVPSGICRKVVRKRRHRVRNRKAGNGVGSIVSVSDVASDDSVADLLKEEDDDGDKASGDFEKEMWDRFSGAGFWRSASARETTGLGP